MFKRIIKTIIDENRRLHQENKAHLKELEWANIYHDSIRGKKELQNLSLNIGRWAGNYTFFYILNRILTDYKPNSIIELGLGESSKFISVFIENYSKDTSHLIIEESSDWRDSFNSNFKLFQNSKIEVCNLVTKQVRGVETNGYDQIENFTNSKFDLYIVDGPLGSLNYSRYDILKFVENLGASDDFIIIVDDYHRNGEKETANELATLFDAKKIKINTAVYAGVKSLIVFATEKYKYATSF
ncbi:hypothetical protein KO493_15725 [Tamlana agarivorans]|uniref:Uncharacterized protein n=1 Tax=Pseudotamlana agarivorans TaxID=481183 RepID=A0ACC5UD56_9FLAO|nr:hypothetical protein [Tamlana agarivorans]MBU2952150.1 hypothetical protein [Tamlana agarivorans]